MGQKEGSLSTPSSKRNRRDAPFTRHRRMGPDGDRGLKERGNYPTPNDTRDGMLTSIDVGSGEAVQGPNFWLKRSHTYQARKIQAPVKTNNKLGIRGTVKW